MTRSNRSVFGGALALATVLAWTALPHAETPGLRLVSGWAKMAAGEWEIGRVAVDPKGTRFFAFRRMDAPILEFDPQSGKLLREWGEGMFVWPHGMYVDREGFLWVTDGGPRPPEVQKESTASGLMAAIPSGVKNGRGYVVVKFSPDRRVVMTLGKPGVSGNGPDTLGSPNDVVVGNNGDIFVADGHANIAPDHPRVVKYSKDGKFIKQWGKKGKGPGEFNEPHALVIDSRGRLLVSDRGNGRIQLFTQDGEFIEQWTTLGGPSGMALGPNDLIYVTTNNMIVIGSAKDGSRLAEIPDVRAEGITADAKGNVWAGEVYRRAIKKFVPASTAGR